MASRWLLFGLFLCFQEDFLDANGVLDVFRELEMVDYEGKLSTVPCGSRLLSFFQVQQQKMAGYRSDKICWVNYEATKT